MHPSPISRGAKLFAKRAAAGKMMGESELGYGGMGPPGTAHIHPEHEEDSDSASSTSLDYEKSFI